MTQFNIEPQKRRWPKIVLILAIILLIGTIGSVLVVRRTYEENLRPVSQSQEIVVVNVVSGASAEEIALLLEEKQLIRAKWAFEWYIRTNDLRSSLLAGTYNLQPNQSIPEIVDVLTNGKIATDLVTILPGQRLDQIRQALINNGFSEADVDVALDPNLYTDHPALVDKPKGASLEGYIYPESFQKTSSTKPEVIIRASLDQMQKFLTPDLRAGIVRQGLTVHEGITLASIVEREIGAVKPEERPQVAQVFLKRLKDGMALESDATAIYGVVVDGKLSELSGQLAQILTYDSDYNTYFRKGLTPGPISNVAVTSLEAIAMPASTNFVFFVTGRDCQTRFSENFAQHQANIDQFGVATDCKA